jgi:O-acetyl-ADP-ribose deacetylase (regulator of RNase III)/predicted RNA-binding Zn-ribbon protein involved in translation (DUF1610 family)
VSRLIAIVRRRPRPLYWTRRWRWRRKETRQVHDLRGYRTPIQVCPRGCEYRELARRDVMTRTLLLGRVAMHAVFTFETTNCPECGARLSRRCARCNQEIFAPVADRCQFCGLPQPWAADRRPGSERGTARPWRPDPDVNDPARPLYHARRGDVWVIEGDIARLKVDAVVSNDDVDGRMWAQVARAIKSAAGDDVERLAQQGKPFRLGHAWVTKPGALKMEGIIHVASMGRHGESRVEIVQSCLAAALDIATEQRYESIGVAAIGSGPASIDPREWFRAFACEAIAHLTGEATPETPRLSIVLVLFEPSEFEEDVRLLQRAIWDAWIAARRPADCQPEIPFEAWWSKLHWRRQEPHGQTNPWKVTLPDPDLAGQPPNS